MKQTTRTDLHFPGQGAIVPYSRGTEASENLVCLCCPQVRRGVREGGAGVWIPGTPPYCATLELKLSWSFRYLPAVICQGQLASEATLSAE